MLTASQQMMVKRAPFVLIVSRDTNEAPSLQSLCQLSGLECMTTTRMDAGRGERRPSIVVIFPDEFSATSADGVRRLMRRFTEATVVIVTFAVAFFESLAQRIEGRRRSTYVLPLPTWGWALAERLLAVTESTMCQEQFGFAAVGK